MTENAKLVVALVPAKNAGSMIAETVDTLLTIAALDKVVVIDDGSDDDTAEKARATGAVVLQLEVNQGKGAAISHGIANFADAGIYVLIDADLTSSSAIAEPLLQPVLADEADMTIAAPGSAGRKGGFGTVKRFAAWGIRKACGYESKAPLSGQRAVKGDLLRSLKLEPRFGLEVGLTIDAQRQGARIKEIDLPVEHLHMGRSISGFVHRGRQGVSVLRALIPRLKRGTSRLPLWR